MSEQVEVWRGGSTKDAYGNDRQGVPSKVSTLVGDVAGSHFDESTEVGRSTLLAGGTVYFRTSQPIDIRDTDQLKIRGQKFMVEGSPVVWLRRSSGSQIGVAVVFRKAEG